MVNIARKSKLKIKAKYYVLSNPLLRKAALLALSAPFIVNNPVYECIYKKQVGHVIKCYSEKPQLVQLEPTNICNLRCINCPHHIGIKRKTGFMEMELYKKIIDECMELRVNGVYLAGVGEPTLDKLLIDKVAYAKMSGIDTLTLYTNAVLLTPQLSRELIEGSLDELKVSIDAATSGTYDIMRPSSKLEVVEENLRNLIELRKKLKSTGPQITVKFIKEPENINEVTHFRRRWKGLADKVFISFPHNWGGTTTRGKSEWRGSTKREPCTMPFRMLNIFWDGSAPLCCLDSECEVLLGNVKSVSISEVWHSKKLQEIRQTHLDGNFDKIPLCDRCSFRDVWWLY